MLNIIVSFKAQQWFTSDWLVLEPDHYWANSYWESEVGIKSKVNGVEYVAQTDDGFSITPVVCSTGISKSKAWEHPL